MIFGAELRARLVGVGATHESVAGAALPVQGMSLCIPRAPLFYRLAVPLYKDSRAFTEVILGIIDDLVASYRQQGDLQVDVDQLDRVRVVATVTTEAHDAAEATALLIRAPLVADACNASRRALEHAVTAAWLAAGHGSVEEFGREKGSRRAAAFVRTLQQAGVSIDPKVIDDALAALPPRSDDERTLQHFGNMCNVFNAKLYALYRLLSDIAHPSVSTVVRAYHSDGKEAAERQDAEVLIAALTAAASMVWARRALDNFDKDHAAREWLEDVAGRLEIAQALVPGMTNDGWPA